MDPTDLMVRALQGVPESIGDPNLQWRDPVPATAGIVKGLYGGLEDTAKQAIDSAGTYAKTGEYDPKPIVNATMMAAGGATPFAEAGAAGIFGGRLAANADLDALKWAQKMRIEGKSRPYIFDETGWWRKPDEKWRHEILDTNAGLNENLLTSKAAKIFDEEGITTELPVRGAKFVTQQGNILRGIPDYSNYTANQVMRHPDLYEAYPFAKRMSIHRDPVRNEGSYWPLPLEGKERPWIDLGDATLSRMRGNLLHEMQHGVQHREGFPMGSTPNRNASNQLNEWLRYRGSPGEVEANAVQLRSYMTPEQLQQWYPWQTERFVRMNPHQNMESLVKWLRNQ